MLQSTWLQNDGSSVLMSASANGNVEIFAARKWCSDRCVLERRPINCLVCSYTEQLFNRNGFPPLMSARYDGYAEVVDVLLGSGTIKYQLAG